MRRLVNSFVHSAVAFCAACIIAVTAHANVANDAFRVSKFEKNHVELQVLIPKKVVSGSSAEVTFVVTNKGDTEVQYGEINNLDELHITIVDQSGTVPTKTRLGEFYFRKRSYPVVHKFVNTYLGANEPKTWKIDLSKYFVLSSGRYVISASIEIQISRGGTFFDVAATNLKLKVE